MKTMTFLVNGAAAGQARSTAWVTINEIEGGKLTFKVSQLGAIGNLRGVYFDVADKSILGTLRVNAESADTDISISDNSSDKSGVLTRMDGSQYGDNEHSLELEVKESEVDRKATNSYSFTFDSTKRKLVLGDFANIQLDYSVVSGASGTQCDYDYSHGWLYMSLA